MFVRFKIGDVVTLKSGSPRLTVRQVDLRIYNGVLIELVDVSWIGNDECVKIHCFHSDMLLPVK